MDLLFLPKLRRDKRELDRLSDLSDLLPVLCRFRGRGTILANQDPEELAPLCATALRRPPRVVVEIGTAKGGTLYLWTRICARGGKVISIDEPGEIGSVGRSTLSVYRTFGWDRGIRVFTIASDSHSQKAHRQLRQTLGDQKVDFIFIDGDHSYQGVRADFYEYQACLSADGIIALHDVAVPDSDPAIQVGGFWSEIQGKGLQVHTLVAKPGKSPGIGVVYCGANAGSPS